jgi:hypothetical protein
VVRERAPPMAYSPECVEDEFCELRLETVSKGQKGPSTMDLRGCKTTKQGLLGSPLAAHEISLGVFHEFSDSL